jgi:hypothetical protein
LAIVFAVEAKTAWFESHVGPGSEVRAAKARPADLPCVIEHGVLVPAAVPPLISFALLAGLTVERPSSGVPDSRDASTAAYADISLAAFFSPPVFFRPPPALS